MRKTIPVLLASAAVALPVALVAHAHAAQRQHGIVLYDALGTPVAVLQPIAGAQQARDAAPDPALTMIRQIEVSMQPGFAGPLFPADFLAEQDAMLRQAMQQIDSLATAQMPSPGMIEAALGAAPGTASQVMVSSFSSGNGTCSETVSYSYPGNGGAPQVAVRKIGDACGAVNLPQMGSVPAAQPVAPSPERITPPPVGPGGAHLIRVDYRHAARPAYRLHG